MGRARREPVARLRLGAHPATPLAPDVLRYFVNAQLQAQNRCALSPELL